MGSVRGHGGGRAFELQESSQGRGRTTTIPSGGKERKRQLLAKDKSNIVAASSVISARKHDGVGQRLKEFRVRAISYKRD